MQRKKIIQTILITALLLPTATAITLSSGVEIRQPGNNITITLNDTYNLSRVNVSTDHTDFLNNSQRITFHQLLNDGDQWYNVTLTDLDYQDKIPVFVTNSTSFTKVKNMVASELAIILALAFPASLFGYFAFQFKTREEENQGESGGGDKGTIALKMFFSVMSMFFGMGTTFVGIRLAQSTGYPSIASALNAFLMAWVVVVMVYISYLFLMVVEDSIRIAAWDGIKSRLKHN